MDWIYYVLVALGLLVTGVGAGGALANKRKKAATAAAATTAQPLPPSSAIAPPRPHVEPTKQERDDLDTRAAATTAAVDAVQHDAAPADPPSATKPDPAVVAFIRSQANNDK